MTNFAFSLIFKKKLSSIAVTENRGVIFMCMNKLILTQFMLLDMDYLITLLMQTMFSFQQL
jgi:hypothetical protein